MVKIGGKKKISTNHLSESVEFHNRPTKKIGIQISAFFFMEMGLDVQNRASSHLPTISKNEHWKKSFTE